MKNYKNFHNIDHYLSYMWSSAIASLRFVFFNFQNQETDIVDSDVWIVVDVKCNVVKRDVDAVRDVSEGDDSLR